MVLAWVLNYLGVIELEVDANAFVIALSTAVMSGVSYLTVYLAPRNKDKEP